jgi:hypothetical protein
MRRTFIILFTFFHGIKKAHLRRDRLGEWIAVHMTTEFEWHGYPHPAPLLPDRGPMGSTIPFGDRRSGIRYSIVRPPVGSLSVITPLPTIILAIEKVVLIYLYNSFS